MSVRRLPCSMHANPSKPADCCRHKRKSCIASLTEMGYGPADAAAAAEAAGCELSAAAGLLLDGGLSGKESTAVSVIR